MSFLDAFKKVPQWEGEEHVAIPLDTIRQRLKNMFEPKGLFASSPYKGQINTDCALGPYGWTIEATTNKLDHYNLTLTQKDGMVSIIHYVVGTAGNSKAAAEKFIDDLKNPKK
jgi:hypothetical protein